VLIGYYLPTLARAKPVYVQHVLNGAMAHGASSGIGAWQGLFIAGVGYSIGGLLFGVALFRAGVLSRPCRSRHLVWHRRAGQVQPRFAASPPSPPRTRKILNTANHSHEHRPEDIRHPRRRPP
jgi:hypothetical protein